MVVRQSPLIMVSCVASMESGVADGFVRTRVFFAGAGFAAFAGRAFMVFGFFCGVRGMVLYQVAVIKKDQDPHCESRRITGQGRFCFSERKMIFMGCEALTG